MAVWQLDDELWFPNPRWGEDDGLVAIGGDLSVERLVLAYSNGFFPWYAFQMERELRIGIVRLTAMSSSLTRYTLAIRCANC